MLMLGYVAGEEAKKKEEAAASKAKKPAAKPRADRSVSPSPRSRSLSPVPIIQRRDTMTQSMSVPDTQRESPVASQNVQKPAHEQIKVGFNKLL